MSRASSRALLSFVTRRVVGPTLGDSGPVDEGRTAAHTAPAPRIRQVTGGHGRRKLRHLPVVEARLPWEREPCAYGVAKCALIDRSRAVGADVAASPPAVLLGVVRIRAPRQATGVRWSINNPGNGSIPRAGKRTWLLRLRLIGFIG